MNAKMEWGVITSYSIHYTKLYDAELAEVPAYLIMTAFVVLSVLAGRITSYNVCYTKLLRVGHAANFGANFGHLPAGQMNDQWHAFFQLLEFKRIVIAHREFRKLAIVLHQAAIMVAVDHQYRIVPQTFIRITSYNVCYTKLLRERINCRIFNHAPWLSNSTY